jgi:hypothetical protein
VAEQLMMLAANYLELAERTLKLRQPIVIRLPEIESKRAGASKVAQPEHQLFLDRYPERNS